MDLRISRRFAGALVAFSALALVACDDSSSSGGGEGTTGEGASTEAGNGEGGASEVTITSEECQDECGTKATSCGASGAEAGIACGFVCGAGLTDEQLTCLQDTDCTSLIDAFVTGAAVCGIGEEEDPGDGSGNGNGNPIGGAIADVGDACECDGPTYSCLGTETGCGFSDEPGDPVVCMVNSDESNLGFCTLACDPDDDQCPSGSSCTPIVDYILGETDYVCE